MSSLTASVRVGALDADGAGVGAAGVGPRVSELGRAHALMLGLLGLAFVGLYFRWINHQLGPSGWSWTLPEDWGHAYVAPLVSGYFVWKHRERIGRLRARPFWPGFAVLMLSASCYVFFIVGYPNHMFQGLALMLSLGGVILLVLGPEVFRALLFPVSYLGFAVTISESVMLKVTWGLKLLASQGSEFFLSLVGPIFGLEVIRNGNILRVIHGGEEHPLNVADACSGMRMVVAFIALAVAVAFFSCRQWWQRSMVILLAVPVALLMNVLRVGVLGLLTISDPELAVGGAHAMIGTLLLAPALALFMACVWAIRRITPDEPERPAPPAGAGSRGGS